MPTIELRVLAGSQAGSMIPLAEGKFLIGREHDCHLRPNSELVSRHHCAFTVDAHTVRLRDLGSTNGTFVNDEAIRGMTMLKPGDRVRVGKVELLVVVDGQPEVSAEETIHASSDKDETLVTARPQKEESVTGDSTIDISTMAEAVAQLEDDTQYLAPAAAESDETTAEPPQPTPSDTQEFVAAVAEAPEGQPPEFAPNPWANAPQYPQPGGYPQYPGMPYGYGYPYPGVPQPPPGYGYPPQPMPGQPPMPAQEAEPPAEPKKASDMPEIRLPDPKETGAKAPAPPAAGGDQKAEGSGKSEEHVPTAAQSIINSYLNRKPKTE